jgi:sigma-70-like protein
VAFVLHDMFGVPFDDIARIVDRSPEAARQLASRARRRVRAENAVPDADLDTQREVVEAYLAAARDGDFERLVAVLDPEVVLRADLGPPIGSREVRGAEAVAGQAVFYQRRLGLVIERALVNGAAGWVALRDGQPFAVAGPTAELSLARRGRGTGGAVPPAVSCQRRRIGMRTGLEPLRRVTRAREPFRARALAAMLERTGATSLAPEVVRPPEAARGGGGGAAWLAVIGAGGCLALLTGVVRPLRRRLGRGLRNGL